MTARALASSHGLSLTVQPVASEIAVRSACAVFGVKRADLLGDARGTAQVAAARHALLLLLSSPAPQGCEMTRQEIVGVVGRSPSTISESITEAGRRRKADHVFAAATLTLFRTFQAGGPSGPTLARPPPPLASTRRVAGQ
jgi:hypothetical protein